MSALLAAGLLLAAKAAAAPAPPALPATPAVEAARLAALKARAIGPAVMGGRLSIALDPEDPRPSTWPRARAAS